eukprot:355127-Chlamydomonas_euryale.AAC.5
MLGWTFWLGIPVGHSWWAFCNTRLQAQRLLQTPAGRPAAAAMLGSAVCTASMQAHQTAHGNTTAPPFTWL